MMNYPILSGRVSTSSIIGLLFVVMFYANVFADDLSPGEGPGSQAERFKAEAEERKKELEPKKEKPPEMEIKEKEKKAVPEGPSFTLSGVTITGATLFTEDVLRPAYEAMVGKKVTFRDLEDVVRKIRERYAQKGYLTTVIYIPEQEIADGKVEIRVQEGVMGKLAIEGNKWFSTALITHYIHQKIGQPLNLIALQKDLIRLNRNSDMEISSVIAKGAEPETSDVTLKVKDRFPHHAGVSYDNQGTRLVGKYRTGLSLRSTNLTGNNDSVFVNTLVGTNFIGQAVIYQAPINTRGTKVGFDFTFFTMRLGREYKQLDISGKSQMYTPHISQELFLSERTQVDADTGVKIKSIQRIVDNETTTNDQLREPYLGFEVSHIDPFFGGGQTTFSPQAVFGTEDFLGASPRDHLKASRNGSGGFFAKYAQSVRRVQKMPYESYLLMRSEAQISTHTLPSSEQIQFGGANSIRGYPEGDYLADMGANLNLDWVFPMYLFPNEWKLPFSDMPLRRQIQPVVFFDMGGGKLKKTNPGEREDKFLASLGGGLRVNLFRNIYVRLEWAGRIGERASSGAGPSVFHLTVQSEI